MKQTTTSNTIAKPRWKLAQSKQHLDERQQRANRRTTSQYFEVLKAVKTLHMPKHSEPAFERDYTKHPDNSGIAIHCFMTKSFCWYLCCGASLEYILYYAFDNCPFEDEVNTLISSFSPNYYIQPYVIHPDLPTAFKRHLRLEDSSFFRTAW